MTVERNTFEQLLGLVDVTGLPEIAESRFVTPEGMPRVGAASEVPWLEFADEAVRTESAELRFALDPPRLSFADTLPLASFGKPPTGMLDFNVVFPASGLRGRVSGAYFMPEGRVPYVYCDVYLPDGLQGGKATPIVELQFHLAGVDLPCPIRMRAGDALAHRFTSVTPAGVLTIDALPRLLVKPSSPSRLPISHVGTWIPAAAMSVVEIEQLLRIFRVLFGVMRGAYCDPFLIDCADGSGDVSHRAINIPRLPMRRPQAVRRFVPSSAASMETLLLALTATMRDEEWARAIETAVAWYLEVGSEDANQDSALVLAQAAIEVLAWRVLVEDRRIVSDRGFEALAAADRIRLMLSLARASLEPPPAASGLVALFQRKLKRSVDGPDIVVEMRNSIVHPKRQKRQQLEQAERSGVRVAAQLCLSYFELLLLWVTGYNGEYVDSLSGSRARPVPWQ